MNKLVKNQKPKPKNHDNIGKTKQILKKLKFDD